ncbi:hypothetical protein [Methanolacinia petrolearia]|uniref:hypothetical protein n=1 Tax=Methanolacinia petrolearia TaxID=54120 RepID=UPI0016511FD7|nr:hypothetical protein [Methanolacinia petrolearia]
MLEKDSVIAGDKEGVQKPAGYFFVYKILKIYEHGWAELYSENIMACRKFRKYAF